jgi:hypothetical protein
VLRGITFLLALMACCLAAMALPSHAAHARDPACSGAPCPGEPAWRASPIGEPCVPAKPRTPVTTEIKPPLQRIVVADAGSPIIDIRRCAARRAPRRRRRRCASRDPPSR